MSIVYHEDWVTKLQERLSEPTKWKDFMNVEIANIRVLHNPYRADPSVVTITPYSAYSPAAVALTDEYITINNSFAIPEIIDRADLAQSGYLKQMEMADMQGILLNEKIESYIYSQYAQLTTFDNTEIGGAAGNITVSSSNIDDIIRAVVRKINVAKGMDLAQRNGIFIVWRPTDYELLTAFMQANGFVTADTALRDGANFAGVNYMGVTHYTSNLLTAGHLVAGVKKLWHLGLLQDTYGQIMVNEKDPGNVSGISIVSRIDLEAKAWHNTKPVLYNITVA
jgi:hypothetical protein